MSTCSAVGSDDHRVVVVDVTEIESVWLFTGGHGPVKSVSLWHCGKATADGDDVWVVASSAADGNVRVWRMAPTEVALTIKPVASIDCVPVTKAEPVSACARFEAVFRPNDVFVDTVVSAVPVLAVLVDNVVELLTCRDVGVFKSWKKAGAASGGHILPISTLAWHGADGSELVTCDRQGNVGATGSF